MSTDGGLQRSFFATDPVTLAKKLLNKVLIVGECSGRIVEVEAYDGANDPASHAFRGETQRNSVMFGPAGHLYVYFTYGMHFCCNVVAREEGTAAAVLIRGLIPLTGLETMRIRRGDLKHGDKHLTSGPARLCQALGIDRTLDGADLVTGDQGVRISDDGTTPPRWPLTTGRIGIRHGTELQWRFSIK